MRTNNLSTAQPAQRERKISILPIAFRTRLEDQTYGHRRNPQIQGKDNRRTTVLLAPQDSIEPIHMPPCSCSLPNLKLTPSATGSLRRDRTGDRSPDPNLPETAAASIFSNDKLAIA